jgi:hypothetical protein
LEFLGAIEELERSKAMESASKLDVEAYVKAMQRQMEEKFRAVAEAVNRAPDGQWINASEMEVRDLFAQMRQEAYEKALQMRVNAAEAAFSPGGPQGQESGEQRV